MNQKEEEKEEEPREARPRFSCTKCFDALAFCYSPVYQMQQYYRLGAFDNCSKKWSSLFDCLKLKTKRISEAEAILEAREKEKIHIWSFRNKEEAEVHWMQLNLPKKKNDME